MPESPTIKQQSLEILLGFPFYRELSTSFQEKLLKESEYATLPRGTYYFEEGHHCSRIALVGKGDIRVFKRGENGREITLYHVGRGQTCILTASCMLSQSAYPASAIVENDAGAVLFPANMFRDWMSQNDIIQRFIFSSMANRMEGVLSLIEEITFGKLNERLMKFLKAKSLEDPGHQSINMTHEDIAIELGSAREVISRILKDFERKGLIKQSRSKILLCD